MFVVAAAVVSYDEDDDDDAEVWRFVEVLLKREQVKRQLSEQLGLLLLEAAVEAAAPAALPFERCAEGAVGGGSVGSPAAAAEQPAKLLLMD